MRGRPRAAGNERVGGSGGLPLGDRDIAASVSQAAPANHAAGQKSLRCDMVLREQRAARGRLRAIGQDLVDPGALGT